MKEPKIFYPLELEARKQQIEMLEHTKKSINYTKKYILLDAPTGVGKSYFCTMFINWYLNNVDDKANFDILTNSKVLQQQYMNEFDYIKNLKGRANYRCDMFDTDCEKGMELCHALKKSCGECPYKQARKNWIESRVSLTNFHLYNTFSMYNQEPLIKRDTLSRVLIIDEAHDFEAVFSDFISIKLSAKTMNKYGFLAKEIEDLDKRISKIKTVEQIYSFLKFFFIERTLRLSGEFQKEIETNTDTKRSIELTKYISHLTGQIEKFQNFVKEYDSVPKKGDPDPKENWVLDVSKWDKNTFGSGIELSLQPVWVHNYLPKFVWDRYDHIILMSGTILDKNMFAYINGLEPKLTTYKSIESPFPVKNRPIYYIKCGKMTYKEKEETFKKQKFYIEKILDKYKGDKGIIHCTTYEFSNWIQESVFNKRLLFHTAQDREERLEEHLTNGKDSVIVSPSMHTGVDLKDDFSRFQILMKIPYPNISSNKVKQRQKTKPEWYSWKTNVDLIQALGRSVRSMDDKADSYILDSSLSTLLMYNGDTIPRWITNAIKEIKK